MTVPLATVVELGSVHTVLKCDVVRSAVIAGPSPVPAVRAGIGTAGRPLDTTTDTLLPCLSLRPGFGFWLRIWPTGAVIEVSRPPTFTTNRSWCSLASAWATERPTTVGSL